MISLIILQMSSPVFLTSQNSKVSCIQKVQEKSGTSIKQRNNQMLYHNGQGLNCIIFYGVNWVRKHIYTFFTQHNSIVFGKSVRQCHWTKTYVQILTHSANTNRL